MSAARKWVVNSSPLILLGRIERLSLLQKLCAELVIPVAVAAEIRAGLQADAAQNWLNDKGATYIRALKKSDEIVTAWDLGAGESEVLTWARSHAGYEAIVDDRAARDCAYALRIPIRGTLGVILLAKKEGLVPRAAPLFHELRNVGWRIHPEVLEMGCKLAGESLE